MLSQFMSQAGRFIPRPQPTFLKSVEERLGLAFLALALLLVGLMPAPAHEFHAGELHLDHPWSRETPLGASVAGGYLVIRNDGAHSDRLVAVSSEIAARGEIHEMAVRDGVMTMRPLPDGLEIPAGGTVRLEPGSFHVMFIGLKRQPRDGETFPAELVFEKAGSVAVEFSVGPMGGGHGGHGAHGG